MFDQSLDMTTAGGSILQSLASTPGPQTSTAMSAATQEPDRRSTARRATAPLGAPGAPRARSRLTDGIRRHRHVAHSGDRATATQRKESTMTPTRTRKSLAVAAGMATAGALALAACSSGGAPSQHRPTAGGGGAGDNSGYTFAMVTHETPGDTFWDKIKAGAQQAAKNNGSPQVLQRPGPDQAGHADPERRRLQGRRHRHDPGHAGRARRRGQDGQRGRHPGRHLQLGHRPVPAGRRPDVLRLRREPGRAGGRQADRRRRRHKILCAIQQPARSPSRTAARASRTAFPNTENLQVNGADDAVVIQRHPGQADPGQDDQLGRHPRRAACPRHGQGRPSSRAAGAKVGTFDTNPDAAQAVQDGKIQWFIDQQPYLQGYMAITQLYLFKKNGNVLGGGQAVLTGPSFVDKTNIAQILPFIKQNTR